MTDQEQYVYDLYTSVLGRAPDPQGFANNLAALQSGQVDAATLAADFANSAEAQSNNIPASQEQAAAQQVAQSAPPSVGGGSSGSDPNAIVSQIYQAVLGRAPDAGASGWAKAIAGGADPATVAQEIANSAEGQAYAASNPINAIDQKAAITGFGNYQPGQAVSNNTAKVLQGAKLVNQGVVDPSGENSQPAIYQLPNGSQISVDASSGQVLSATPPTASYSDPANQRPGYRNIPYAFSSMRDQSTININGVDVPLVAPELVVNPNTHQPIQQNGQYVTIQSVSPQPSSGTDWALPLTMMVLAPFTGGASLALGEAILGAGATGALTLGTAMTAATMNAAVAAATGGNVAQAAIKGAIGGAVGVNSADVAASIVGGGDVINGMATINEIANATGQTNAQVSNIISNTVSTTLNAAATGNIKGSIVSAIGNNLAATTIGNFAGNVLNNMTDSQFANAAKAVGAVSQVASSAAMNGKDINAAITNNLPQIVGNYVGSTIKSATPAPTTPKDSFTQAALGLGYTQNEIDNFVNNKSTPSGSAQIAGAGAVSDVALTPTEAAVKQISGGPQASVTVEQLKSPEVPTDSKGNVYIKQPDGTYNIMDPNNKIIGTSDTLPTDTTTTTPAATDSQYNILDSLWSSINNPSSTAPSTAVGTGTGSGQIGTTPGTGGGGTGTGGTGTGGTGTGTGGTGTGTGVGVGTGVGIGIGGTGTGGTKTTTTKTTTTGGTTTTPILSTIPALYADTGIQDLKPGLVQGSAFKFANEPTFSEQVNPVPVTQPYDYSGQILNAASGGSTTTSDITDLSPGIARGKTFTFANSPKFVAALNQIATPNPTDYTQQILNAAQGGLVGAYAEGGQPTEEPSPTLRPQLLHGHQLQPMGHFQGAHFAGYQPKQYAAGGDVEQEHNPEFFSVGGLESIENKYVKGDGDGTSDSVPAMLANGEFVIPADVVSKLGNGSNDAGADVLDKFLVSIREHAQDHDPKKLPPQSKGPLAYLLDAKRKVG